MTWYYARLAQGSADPAQAMVALRDVPLSQIQALLCKKADGDHPPDRGSGDAGVGVMGYLDVLRRVFVLRGETPERADELARQHANQPQGPRRA